MASAAAAEGVPGTSISARNARTTRDATVDRACRERRRPPGWSFDLISPPRRKVRAGCRCTFEADVRRGDASRQWRVDERRARMVQRRTGGRGNGHTRGRAGWQTVQEIGSWVCGSFAVWQPATFREVCRPFAKLAGRPRLVIFFSIKRRPRWTGKYVREVYSFQGWLAGWFADFLRVFRRLSSG